MTTISPNRRRTRTRNQLLLLSIGGIVLLFVAFFLRAPLTSVLMRVVVPLAYARDFSLGSVGNFFNGFATNRALVKENARLEAALASTSVALLDRSMLYRENTELKGRLA